MSWRQGERFVAGTAGGGTPSYMVMLDTRQCGRHHAAQHQAAVIVADSTDNDILLGMSFLEKQKCVKKTMRSCCAKNS
jgi:predicted aspartyl protease